MTCLWLARALPFPLTAGDRIYSAKLASALAAAGAEVTFAGFAGETPPTDVPGLRWHVVPGRPRGQVAALASTMPLVAARHATASYAEAIRELARRERWDAVVVDQYGMGWALRHAAAFGAPRPVFVHVSHDHEESVTRLQWQDPAASPAKRLYLAQNQLKTRWLERRTARGSDLVTTITAADAALFRQAVPGLRTVTLTPGHDGVRVTRRVIDATVPRAIVLFGSYRWSAKQANLRAFLDAADTRLAAAGVQAVVVGDVPEDLRRALEGRYRSARFTGFVADPAPHLAAARLAVVAEPIGGGFKMKLLDYVFSRVPVAALDACAAGLSEEVRAALLLRPDLDGLLDGVLAAIDDLPWLNAQQDRAYAAAEGAFDWLDRGRTLLHAITEARARVSRP
jgi:glycosyltransferase involved in cell wall biosynthesis